MLSSEEDERDKWKADFSISEGVLAKASCWQNLSQPFPGMAKEALLEDEEVLADEMQQMTLVIETADLRPVKDICEELTKALSTLVAEVHDCTMDDQGQQAELKDTLKVLTEDLSSLVESTFKAASDDGLARVNDMLMDISIALDGLVGCGTAEASSKLLDNINALRATKLERAVAHIAYAAMFPTTSTGKKAVLRHLSTSELEVGSKIAQGSFIWLQGTLAGDSKPVAVKVCKAIKKASSKAEKGDALLGLLKLHEADASLQLACKHPNVQEILGVCHAHEKFPDALLVASPLLSLGSLKDVLFPTGNASEAVRTVHHRIRHEPTVLADTFAGVSAALQHMHGQSPPVLHLNLKPANILMSILPGGILQPKLYDFLSVGQDNSVVMLEDGRTASASTAANTASAHRRRTIEAYRYMSPEQLRGVFGADDTPADVFTLAIVMAECITFKRFCEECRKAPEVVIHIVNEGRRPLLPDDERTAPYRPVLEDCWHEDASERPTIQRVTTILRDIWKTMRLHSEDAVGDAVNRKAQHTADGKENPGHRSERQHAREHHVDGASLPETEAETLPARSNELEVEPHAKTPPDATIDEQPAVPLEELALESEALEALFGECQRTLDAEGAEGSPLLTEQIMKLRRGCDQMHHRFSESSNLKDRAQIADFVKGFVAQLNAAAHDKVEQRLVALATLHATLAKKFVQLNIATMELHGSEQVLQQAALRRIDESELKPAAPDDLLGKGIFEVYKTRWQSTLAPSSSSSACNLKKDVAVKVYKADAEALREASELKEFFDRVEKHAKRQMSCAHNNVLQIFGSCRQDDSLRLVMPVITEGSLGTILQPAAQQSGIGRMIGGPDNHKRSLALADLFAGISAALAHIHGLKPPVVHLDLKPQNILVVLLPGGMLQPKLSDFDAARVVRDKSLPSSHRVSDGTYGYMSPEVLKSLEKSDAPPADIYSFAMVMAECITGKLTLPGTGFSPSRHKVTSWIVRIYEGERPELPVGTRDLDTYEANILQCWHVDPAQRPASSTVAEGHLKRLKQLRYPESDKDAAVEEALLEGLARGQRGIIWDKVREDSVSSCATVETVVSNVLRRREELIETNQPTDQEDNILQAILSDLHTHVQTAIEHPCTHSVLRHIVDQCPAQFAEFIIRELRGREVFASKHRFGHKVMVQFVKRCSDPEADWGGKRDTPKALIGEVLGSVDELLTHRFGHCVLQEVLEHSTIQEHKELVANAVLRNAIEVAKDDYGCRVVEGVLTPGRVSDAVRQEIVAKLSVCAEDLTGTIRNLLNMVHGVVASLPYWGRRLVAACGSRLCIPICTDRQIKAEGPKWKFSIASLDAEKLETGEVISSVVHCKPEGIPGMEFVEPVLLQLPLPHLKFSDGFKIVTRESAAEKWHEVPENPDMRIEDGMVCFTVKHFCDFGIKHKQPHEAKAENAFMLTTYMQTAQAPDANCQLRCLIYASDCSKCQESAKEMRAESCIEGWRPVGKDRKVMARDQWKVKIGCLQTPMNEASEFVFRAAYGPRFMNLDDVPLDSKVKLHLCDTDDNLLNAEVLQIPAEPPPAPVPEPAPDAVNGVVACGAGATLRCGVDGLIPQQYADEFDEVCRQQLQDAGSELIKLFCDGNKDCLEALRDMLNAKRPRFFVVHAHSVLDEADAPLGIGVHNYQVLSTSEERQLHVTFQRIAEVIQAHVESEQSRLKLVVVRSCRGYPLAKAVSQMGVDAVSWILKPRVDHANAFTVNLVQAFQQQGGQDAYKAFRVALERKKWNITGTKTELAAADSVRFFAADPEVVVCELCPTGVGDTSVVFEQTRWATWALDKGSVMFFKWSMNDLLQSSRLEQTRCILITGRGQQADLDLINQDPTRLAKVLSGIRLVVFAGGCVSLAKVAHELQQENDQLTILPSSRDISIVEYVEYKCLLDDDGDDGVRNTGHNQEVTEDAIMQKLWTVIYDSGGEDVKTLMDRLVESGRGMAEESYIAKRGNLEKYYEPHVPQENSQDAAAPSEEPLTPPDPESQVPQPTS